MTLPTVVFPKIYLLERERLKPWFFMTFSITIMHIIPKLIEVPKVVQKIISVNITYFHKIFGYRDIHPFHTVADD